MLARIALPIAALALLAFAVRQVMFLEQDQPGVALPFTSPTKNPFPNTVSGAGVVEPQTENISVGSPMPGVVVSVAAKFGMKIQVGDELFRLDDRQLRSELAYRKVALEAAKAELTRLENTPRPEQREMSEALVREAEAHVIDLRDQWRRTRELWQKKLGAATEENLFSQEQACRAAEAKLAHARSQEAMDRAGAWEFDRQVSAAAVKRAAAQVQQTVTDLERLVIRALSPGEILQVNVRPGEFVNTPPTQPLIVLGNVAELHVRVDFDEYDIHRFRPDAQAKAYPKGDPKNELGLSFVRVEPYVVPKKSLTGDNGERVDTRVLQVIYRIETEMRRLYVGQQLDVFVDVGHSQDSSGDEAPMIERPSQTDEATLNRERRPPEPK